MKWKDPPLYQYFFLPWYCFTKNGSQPFFADCPEHYHQWVGKCLSIWLSSWTRGEVSQPLQSWVPKELLRLPCTRVQQWRWDCMAITATGHKLVPQFQGCNWLGSTQNLVAWPSDILAPVVESTRSASCPSMQLFHYTWSGRRTLLCWRCSFLLAVLVLYPFQFMHLLERLHDNWICKNSHRTLGTLSPYLSVELAISLLIWKGAICNMIFLFPNLAPFARPTWHYLFIFYFYFDCFKGEGGVDELN